MKIDKITIENYKGIEEIDIYFDSNLRIKTFVGLNESGKTTILEAMSILSKLDFDDENKINDMVPKNKKSNFTGEIKVRLLLKLEESDKKFIKDKISEEPGNLEFCSADDYMVYGNFFIFEAGDYRFKFNIEVMNIIVKKGVSGTKEYKLSKIEEDLNEKIFKALREERCPEFLFFRSLSNTIPNRIYLDENSDKNNYENKIYLEVIKSLFDICEPNVPFDIIKQRIKEKDNSVQKEKLSSTINKIEAELQDKVIRDWEKIFGNNLNAKIKIECDVSDDGEPYISVGLKQGDNTFKISERSDGFNWFFTFLSFVYFKSESIKNKGKELVFLLDEPAKNLHSSAQSKLLERFNKMIENNERSTIIYSTHSQYLIDPKLLLNTYVVKNQAITDYGTDDLSKDVNIEIKKYSEFVGNNKTKNTHFQPILDALNYRPSKLEIQKKVLMVEGKNDYYTLKYLFENYLNIDISEAFGIVPGTSSSNLTQLIQICIAWGVEFLILLDDDKAGRESKEKYINEFGEEIESKIILISDAISKGGNNKLAMESLFDDTEQLRIIKTIYPKETNIQKINLIKQLK